jgi:uncharacterized protein (TIGR00730 family)
MKKLTQRILQRNSKHSSLAHLAQEEQQQAQTLTQSQIEKRMKRINEDFRRGFTLLKQQADTVTFFGSSRFESNNPYYQQACRLAQRIVEEIGSTIVTGGGRGIMTAANQGTEEAQGKSVGMSIELPTEQVTNQYVNYSVDFYYFFSRKVALTFTARAFVYFPGGFGTLDEFFEILTLKQTGKINPIPIILVGSDYWEPIAEFIRQQLGNKFETIDPGDAELFTITDDPDEVIRIISTHRAMPYSEATVESN